MDRYIYLFTNSKSALFGAIIIGLMTLGLAACSGSEAIISGSLDNTTDLPNGTDDLLPDTDPTDSTPDPESSGYSYEYPLERTPAVGNKSLVWVVASFNNKAFPDNALERINATAAEFNKYMKKVARGKLTVNDVRISPVLNIITDDGETPASLGEMQQLVKAEADRQGFDYSGNYLAYYMTADGFENFGGVGSGNGLTGSVSMGPGAWIAGVIHEMIHMFSVGHAEALEGGDVAFPGVNVGGLDPYYFMGSEADAKDCPFNATSTNCDIFATMSIPHQGRAGWLEDSNYEVDWNDGTAKTFKLFNHDNFERQYAPLLATYLRGYDKDGVFVVSYLKHAQSRVISSKGVVVHYVPYVSPAVSRLLDLTPGSITSNPEQPDNEKYDTYYDLGDAAISNGMVADVSDRFSIEVVAEGDDGDENYWADIRITPIGNCIYPPTDFTKEDFVPSPPAPDGCSTGFSYNWSPDESRLPEINLDEQSLEYQALSMTGGSLTMNVDEAASTSLAISRNMQRLYSSGETLWASTLVRPEIIGDGHMLFNPGGNGEGAIGKKWGTQLAIGNSTAPAPIAMSIGETYWLVVKYELQTGADKITLWVNPDPVSEPTEDTAYAQRDDIDIGATRAFSINLSPYGGGKYDIDRVYTGDSFDTMNTAAN